MTTIDNAGVGLHVAVDGPADAPPVLLLHGITSCVHTWDWLVPHLVDRHRVLRLDFRGHGRSDRATSYHFPDYLSDAVAVCEQLAGGPVVAVGHSLGGGTAAALAQTRPDLVSAVVLEDPALARVERDVLEGNALRDVFALMRQSVPMLQASGATPEALAPMLAAGPATSGGTFGDLLHPDALVAMATGLLQMDATVLDPVLDGSMVTAFDPDAAIPVPAIVLAGDPAKPDTIVREPQIVDLATASPQAEVRVVTGAGHLIHDETASRQAVLDAVLEMLGRS